MLVSAISTPEYAGWRWRIVNYAGETVEESHGTFPTIARALAEGGLRLRAIDRPDVSVRANPYGRSTSYLRNR